MRLDKICEVIFILERTSSLSPFRQGDRNTGRNVSSKNLAGSLAETRGDASVSRNKVDFVESEALSKPFIFETDKTIYLFDKSKSIFETFKTIMLLLL